jgi:hypothetical protein
MSKEYGYIGKEVTQAFRDNKGIFTPQDIIELDQENKWTNFGQLELIQTQNADDSSSTLDFTSIKENIYNVHFLTVNNMSITSAGTNSRSILVRLSNNGGTSFISSSTYQRAHQQCFSNGSFSEVKSTGISYLNLTGAATNSTATLSSNCYIYFYNLGDSTKYSFSTVHSSGQQKGNYLKSHFGSAVYPVAETHNAIRLVSSTSSENIEIGSASLYGIRSF